MTTRGFDDGERVRFGTLEKFAEIFYDVSANVLVIQSPTSSTSNTPVDRIVITTAGVRFETNVGFFATTPVARAGAYTQTFATADKTHANATGASVVTTAVTQTSPFGYAGAAQGDAVATTINQIIVDLADLKQLVNSVIDDLQAYGLFQ